jgi:TctA family transporter
MESLFTLGFPVALAWQNLGLCLLGALVGTLLGVLVRAYLARVGERLQTV